MGTHTHTERDRYVANSYKYACERGVFATVRVREDTGTHTQTQTHTHTHAYTHTHNALLTSYMVP